MRICHINLAKSFRGGERQTLLLVRELAKIYPQTIVVKRGNRLFLERLKKIENLTTIEISKPYIFHIAKFKNFDLIHSHEAKASQIALFLNLIFKTPYILTRRVTFEPKSNFFTKLIYKRASYIIAISRAIERVLKSYSKDLKIELIPSAISSLTLNLEKFKKLKLEFKDRFIVGHIGALVDSDKNQSTIIKVAKELSNIEFIFVGDGRDRDYFQELAKDIENVKFIGFSEDIGEYLELFDIFLFPSLNEGLGSILLDAMEFEKPIISSKVGGIVDLIEDSVDGILIENPKDSFEIKKALLKLYRDRELRESLAKSAKAKSKNFYIQNLISKYLKLYRKF